MREMYWLQPDGGSTETTRKRVRGWFHCCSFAEMVFDGNDREVFVWSCRAQNTAAYVYVCNLKAFVRTCAELSLCLDAVEMKFVGYRVEEGG